MTIKNSKSGKQVTDQGVTSTHRLADINPIQAVFDCLSKQWQQDRSETQMTLGKLIDALLSLPQEKEIDVIENPHSYRGYYNDLAFEKSKGKCTVSKTLEMCRSCMGEVFQGYKGGEYQMGRNTPIWLAKYGCCGKKITALLENGNYETQDED